MAVTVFCDKKKNVKNYEMYAFMCALSVKELALEKAAHLKNIFYNISV